MAWLMNLRLGHFTEFRTWNSLFRSTTYVSRNLNISLPGPPVRRFCPFLGKTIELEGLAGGGLILFLLSQAAE